MPNSGRSAIVDFVTFLKKINENHSFGLMLNLRTIEENILNISKNFTIVTQKYCRTLKKF